MAFNLLVILYMGAYLDQLFSFIFQNVNLNLRNTNFILRKPNFILGTTNFIGEISDINTKFCGRLVILNLS